MKNEYITVKNSKSFLEVKKSKFIANSFMVSSEIEAKNTIERQKSKTRDASHNVYAYVLSNGVSKSCDDGEPAGTAGVQVLKAITNENLTNSLIIVTRYFGGIKLGTGGLSRAYFESAKKLLENENFIHKKMCYKIQISFDYSEYNKIPKKIDYRIIDLSFNSNVDVTFAIETEKIKNFIYEIENILSRKININLNIIEYFDF